MSLNDWVNLLTALVGMFGILTPYVSSYGKSKSFIGRTKRIKELINARRDLGEILSRKQSGEQFPSSAYINELIRNIDSELESLERKRQIGLFFVICTIEAGAFFIFSRLSSTLSHRVFGPVGQGGYGFWEGVLEPIAFRVALILFLTIASVSVTIVFISTWWGLVWIDRLTPWL
jgi:hypothetical protein